ncbi:hypothetical protein Pan97_44040 [Bremerella volcania]|uniref:DUF3592 domain-containing protein n=1 Tax=Bremerella volcania TaxID=2527984 RepID=A0A518CDN7_9BACT|nr:DUF3592 domain-containing protein [Bremerella volcania]QDU77337.1 hypothetical protein Pan97_44040 [Bremerella volcania]
MESVPPRKSHYRKLGPWSTILAGALLAGVGLIGLVFPLNSASQGAESDVWPTVMGTVTVSQVESSGPKDDRSYYPEVKYQYDVEGKSYTSDRINFDLAGTRSSIRQEMTDVVDQYPAGADVKVFYDPSDPSQSCLEPGVKLGTGFLLGIACVGFGGLVILSGLVTWIRG